MNVTTNNWMPELHRWRDSFLSKFTAVSTAICFSTVFYISPTAKVIADELDNQVVQSSVMHWEGQHLAEKLEGLKVHLDQHVPIVLGQAAQPVGFTTQLSRMVGLDELPVYGEELAYYQQLRMDLEQAYQIEMEQLAQQAAYSAQTLSGISLQAVNERHQNVKQHLVAQFGTVFEQLDIITSTYDRQNQLDAMAALNHFMEGKQFKAKHTAEDPEDLPWGRQNDQVRSPIKTAEEFNLLTAEPQLRSLMRAESDQNPLLSENTEVQLTEEIRNLAEQLKYNPTDIYAWVHNNIRFIPSYGSIQGAQQTLDNLSGNATDTASLLVALLRVSDIPARYVFGTVELPVENVMNWVGNVNTPSAAQRLMGQGGIPTIGIQRGGKVSDIRFEHTWVEAWVDFEPSRGMKNRVGDNWAPMDASYKQYEYTPRMELKENVPFNTDEYLSAVEETTVFDSEKNWFRVSDISQSKELKDQYSQEIINYIDSVKQNATTHDVLGNQIIDVHPPQPLSAGLPYSTVLFSQIAEKVPAKLQHKIKYQLSASSPYQDKMLSVELPTAQVAGETTALSFSPASAEDLAILESYAPKVDPQTGTFDPATVHVSIPGYLVQMQAEFSIGGETFQTGGNVSMGTELNESIGLWSPSHGWNVASNNPTAGEYRAIAFNLQGISAKTINKVNTELADLKAQFDSSPQSPMDAGKHEFVGNMIQSGILSYFSSLDILNMTSTPHNNIVSYRAPSFGVFSTSIVTEYWFGIPRNIKPKGLYIDVDRITQQLVDVNDNHDNETQYLMVSGMSSSSLEHIIPETLFSSPEMPAVGVSAVKALQIAAKQGQRIWDINSDNLDTALLNISVERQIKNEIRNAVLAGKQAIVHESTITTGSWSGAGYILYDELTGAAAYKISGGTNGGLLDYLQENGTMISVGMAFASWILALAPMSAFILLFTIISIFTAILIALANDLTIKENGCPSGLSSIYLLLEAVAIFASFFSLYGLAFAFALSFIYGSGVVAASSVCSDITNVRAKREVLYA